MGTILDSVNNLSEKLGVTAREQTIKDQLDLCVERLGGEGNSVDIAESANKFADKEDGTATFTTKTITENGTYDATDDGVSGYSSVTVDVSGGVTLPFMGMRLPQGLTPGQGTNTYGMCLLNPNDEGTVYTLDGLNGNPSGPQYIIEPVKRINCKAVQYRPGTNIYFTPDQDFDGIYAMIVADGEEGTDYDTKLTLTGATITPGDGMVYYVSIDYNGATSSVTVYKRDAVDVMVPFPTSE